jgi:hypothetical protein
MRLVVIESPYAATDARVVAGITQPGTVVENIRYVRACMRHVLEHGGAPYASHALYTQAGVLDDQIPAERAKGIAAGMAWRDIADTVCFYIDRGWSRGMLAAWDRERRAYQRTEIRSLGAPWSELPAGAWHVKQGGPPMPPWLAPPEARP